MGLLNQPTAEEIKLFLEFYQNLLDFDGQTRYIRGYGAAPPEGFEKGPFPIPALEKVAEWLRDFVPAIPATVQETRDAITIHGDDIRELLHDPKAHLSFPVDGKGIRIEALVHYQVKPHVITYTCTLDGLHHQIKIEVRTADGDVELLKLDAALPPPPLPPLAMMEDIRPKDPDSF